MGIIREKAKHASNRHGRERFRRENGGRHFHVSESGSRGNRGSQGYRETIAEEFSRAGAHVCIIDLLPNPYFVGDVGKQEDLEAFAQKVLAEYGRVDVLVNNALPVMSGLDACDYDTFNYALRVGVTAPFYLAKLFAPYLRPGRPSSIFPRPGTA